MKPSMFNIAQLYNDNILLYNTYSTSLVEIEPAIYNRIFIDGNYSDHKDEIDALFNLVLVEMIVMSCQSKSYYARLW